MKFSFVLSVAVLAASPALSFPILSLNGLKRAAVPDAATIIALAPPLGFHSGVNPTGTGDCDGAINGPNGLPIKIPCSCPPSQADFNTQLIANVQAGHAIHNLSVAVSFPTDISAASRSARLNAASVTLQNLNGTGKGCPIVSTTFQAQQKAINNGVSSPAAKPPAGSSSTTSNLPASSSIPASSTIDAATITSLAPVLGFQAGLNPTGTGDCDGAVKGANGLPIKIPCACPPAQSVYINQLIANVQAGHAINNPTVQISYPTDNSARSQSARITAALITLQNLNGPGKGCPAVSTTLLAQQKALGV